MKNGRRYLRAAHIARLTGMSVRTVRRWIKDEILPSTKLGGARIVAMADLQAVLSGSEAMQATSDKFGEESEELTAVRESISQEHVPCIV